VFEVCDAIIDVVCVCVDQCFDLRANKGLNADVFIKCHYAV